MQEFLSINPESLRGAEGLLIFAVTHLAILANRRVVRPRINNALFDRISCLLEHVASYATLPIGYNAAEHLLHLPNNIGWDAGLALNVTRAFLVDYYMPARAWARGLRREGAQWGQLAADVVGTAAYLSLVH